jgi:ribosome biogenesis GTPase
MGSSFDCIHELPIRRYQDLLPYSILKLIKMLNVAGSKTFLNMDKEIKEGLVLRMTGNEVWVEAGSGVVPCVLRGRFRQKGKAFDLVAGDRVDFSLKGPGGEGGVIEEVLPRKSWLSRYVTGRDEGERTIVANIDALFVIASVLEPRLHYGFVDRVLVSAERGKVPVILCLNKIDLLEDEEVAEAFKNTYQSCGYPIVLTSAVGGDGLSLLEEKFEGGIYAFVGESGVGKSSLLNRIDSQLNLRVGEVAIKTGRGKHTTSFSQLFPIKGGYIADTPGMQTFGFPGDEKTEVSGCFPEFGLVEENCRFRPCTHSHEPDCAVKEACEDGRIFQTRYRSYLSMLAEVIEREKKRYS